MCCFAAECIAPGGGDVKRCVTFDDEIVNPVKCEGTTTDAPTTEAPTTEAPTTEVPATEAPTMEAPTTEAPTTEAPTTEAPTTDALTTEAPTTEAPTTEVFTCDESAWPDKDHDLVCGDCKVLVNNFGDKYKTCAGYCKAVGLACAGAWEEKGDTCQVEYEMTCEQALSSSDAICECEAPTTEAPTTEAPTTEAPTTEAPTTE